MLPLPAMKSVRVRAATTVLLTAPLCWVLAACDGSQDDRGEPLAEKRVEGTAEGAPETTGAEPPDAMG